MIDLPIQGVSRSFKKHLCSRCGFSILAGFTYVTLSEDPGGEVICQDCSAPEQVLLLAATPAHMVEQIARSTFLEWLFDARMDHVAVALIHFVRILVRTAVVNDDGTIANGAPSSAGKAGSHVLNQDLQNLLHQFRIGEVDRLYDEDLFKLIRGLP